MRIYKTNMVIFIDIDGTMRDYRYGFMPSSHIALDRAHEAGHTLILCTGRTVGMIPYDVPLEKFDGMIAGGGCHLVYHGKVIEDSFIPDETVSRYRRYFEENGVPYQLETVEGVFMTAEMGEIMRELLFYGEDPRRSEYAGLRTERIRIDRRIDELDRMGLHSSKMGFCLTPAQYREFHVPDSDRLKYIVFDDEADEYYHCELIQAGRDKGTAIERMAREIGADIGDTIAVGDSMNDADAFRAAGTALCMGNATDAVKALADHVTDTVVNDGLYKGFVALGLI